LSRHTDGGQALARRGRVFEFVSGFARGYAATSWIFLPIHENMVFVTVEMEVLRITQINMIEKWIFLNFKKWGEIRVFFGFSHKHVCF
jgi:hypothetical protein